MKKNIKLSYVFVLILLLITFGCASYRPAMDGMLCKYDKYPVLIEGKYNGLINLPSGEYYYYGFYKSIWDSCKFMSILLPKDNSKNKAILFNSYPRNDKEYEKKFIGCISNQGVSEELNSIIYEPREYMENNEAYVFITLTDFQDHEKLNNLTIQDHSDKYPSVIGIKVKELGIVEEVKVKTNNTSSEDNTASWSSTYAFADCQKEVYWGHKQPVAGGAVMLLEIALTIILLPFYVWFI